MTVRPILQLGNPDLRVIAEPVDPATISSSEIQALIDDLIETMRDAGGAGLAATQIGVHHRVVVMEVNGNPRYPYKPMLPLTVAINPIIEPLDDETVVINEGCLSVPVRGDVTRNVNVLVHYLDRDGVANDRVVRGLTAGTWQHECDHLDGTLIVDRSDPRSLATWEEFDRHHRAAFVDRITAFVERVGS